MIGALSGSDLHPYWFVGISIAVALVPLVIGIGTCYVKFSVALGLLRNGFGTQQMPSGLIVMVLSLAITASVMQPVLSETQERLAGFGIADLRRSTGAEVLQAIAPLLDPWLSFLERHAGARERAALESEDAGAEPGETALSPGGSRPPFTRLLLAFVLTELKEGLMIGFTLLLPFLIVDLVVANVLAGMGMYMVSPTVIALPLKLALFLLADGWLAITRSLMLSYGG